MACTLPAPAQQDPGRLEQGVLDAVNAYRQRQGLAALQPDEGLRALAAAHSQDMARQQQLSHDGFDSRFRQSGRALCVENLAAGHDQADTVLADWQASPSHRGNLLEPRVQQAGIALVDDYLTLLACSTAPARPRRR